MMRLHVLLLIAAPLAALEHMTTPSLTSRSWDQWVSPTAPVQPSSIRKVHVVQSCHLDVGFIDLAVNIINEYFTHFLPAAISIANDLAANKTSLTSPGLVFTTQSWLISLYLNCPTSFPAPPARPAQIKLECPSPAAQDQMRRALREGAIAMHAFPFNSEPEVLDSAMFGRPTALHAALSRWTEWGLNMTRDLARSNGVPAPTVLSQRDVPGLTRATIPLLVKAGAIGINVGINPASAPVGVPSVQACMNDQLATPFIWEDKASNTSVLAAFHPGGYGGIGTDSPNLNCDCLGAPGLDEVLCYGWVGDNGGPPSKATIASNWALLKKAFPNATEIAPSTFDAYYAKLNQPAIRSQLEVVTSEAGDSWVYGCSSDPRKMALIRLFMRARRRHAAGEDPLELSNFTRLLIKASEHTWGSDGFCMEPGKGDLKSWSNADFAAVRSTRLFQQQEDAWHEQRGYFTQALTALGPGSQLAAAITEGIAQLDSLGKKATDSDATVAAVPRAAWGDLLRLKPAVGPGYGLALKLDPDSGAVISLIECRSDACDGSDQAEWASKANPLGRFVYRSRSNDAGEQFWDHYKYSDATWGPRCFEKLGVTSATANETTSYAKISSMHANDTTIIAQLVPPTFISEVYGGPRALQLSLSLPSQAEGLQMTLAVYDKTTSRLPEEGW